MYPSVMKFEDIEEDTENKSRILEKCEHLYVTKEHELTTEPTDNVVNCKDFNRIKSYYRQYVKQNNGYCASCKARKLSYIRDCYEDLLELVLN
jgi:hypothetical protein